MAWRPPRKATTSWTGIWATTVATNAIVTWTTEYYGLAVAALRREGRPVDDDLLAHIWPSHHANVNFYGTHSVDIDGRAGQARRRRLPAAAAARRGPLCAGLTTRGTQLTLCFIE